MFIWLKFLLQHPVLPFISAKKLIKLVSRGKMLALGVQLSLNACLLISSLIFTYGV